jgi:small-conductance mechanosensitive channel/CRP-like cAMP-binding protein
VSAADPLLAPPDGWQRGAFFANLGHELHAHPIAAATSIALLMLLALGSVLLPPQLRGRLRTALVLLLVHAISLVARAELLSLGMSGESYLWLAMIGTMALGFGIVSVSALILFDLLARRFGFPRIMRDITITIAAAALFGSLMSRSGISLLHLVTTSAVVTAVIGLALQDTLGNIIAGVALQLDSAISLGDWVRVDDKVTGRVREIRWRSTLLETKNGDQVVFPNAIVNRSVVMRFNRGAHTHRQWIYFHAALHVPPNRVIAVVLDALKETPNVATTPAPDCLLYDFDGNGAKYAVRYRLVDFVPDDPTDSEVRKRIWYALHRAEIEMPYPTQSVLLTEVPTDHEARQHSTDLNRRLRALARIPLFAPLSDAERKTLAEGLHFMPFATGETILRQETPGDSLFILRRGRVSVRIEVGGEHKELAQLCTGDFFGEMSLLTGAARRASVIALEDTECYVVDRIVFEGILKRNPSLADAIGKLLSERVHALEAERQHLAADARPPSERDLLDRIRGFFGLK